MTQTSEENFSELLEQSLISFNKKEGQIVKGTVLSVKNDSVVIDVGLKSEGRIPLREFFSPGEENSIKPGDTFDVLLEKLENKEGEAMLSREKARKEESWINLEKCLEKKEQITGVITGRVKGGFTVDIDSAVAFLPGSQVDLRPVVDISPLINKPQPMLILKMDKIRGNIVVSRRAILEESREADRSKLLSDITEGSKLTGIVKNITDYGVFVDLGGLDGLLHVTDLSWERVNHPSEILNVGDEIEVLVIKYDQESKRISLGMKQLSADPWSEIESEYKVGKKIKAKISNITDYGAFVELRKGVEGLIHISEMSWTNKNANPNSFVSIDDEVDVIILEVDKEKRRISLGLKQCTENPWKKFAETNKSNDIIDGKIKNITEFGIFIELPHDLIGMVHLSDISWDLDGEEAIKEYNIDQLIKTKIIDIDVEKERVSLGIKQLTKAIGKKKNVSDKYIGSVVTSVVTKIDDNVIEVLVDKNVKGIIKRTHLAKQKSEQKTTRFAVEEKIDAKVINFDKKNNHYELSVKEMEIQEEKDALKQYGSSSSGASLGDILGAALEEGEKKKKNSTKTKDKK
ncbi:30S ribosomal protein S1 [Rickettsiales bacterium]|nr:30S ribosomal protein S1 [Rickettsiales bacterium]